MEQQCKSCVFYMSIKVLYCIYTMLNSKLLSTKIRSPSPLHFSLVYSTQQDEPALASNRGGLGLRDSVYEFVCMCVCVWGGGGED